MEIKNEKVRGEVGNAFNAVMPHGGRSLPVKAGDGRNAKKLMFISFQDAC
jgi:hypothetical protein